MNKVCVGMLICLLLMSIRPALAQGGAPDNPRPGDRLITSVVVSSPSSWDAGQVLTVTLTGEPGGVATFDMGPVLGIACFEGPPGTYRGSYALTPADATLVDPVIVGHLRMPSGQSGDWHPNAAPMVVSINSGGQQTLAPGQTFQITVNGPPGGFGTVDVGQHLGIPLSEVAPGTYMTSYTVQPGDPASVYVVGHVTVDGTPYQATAPQPVYLTGGGLAFTSITSSVPGPIAPGQPVTLTALGTPGRLASFSVNGAVFPMAEVAPGTYVGTWIAPANAWPGTLPLTINLQDNSGRIVSQPAPFNLVVGHRAPGPVPTGNVIIDSPTMRSDVTGGFSVEGRAAPGANLLLQVYLTRDEVPGGDLYDKQFETQVLAGADGSFDIPVVLNGAVPGRLLDVRVRCLDATGNPVSQDEVVVTLR